MTTPLPLESDLEKSIHAWCRHRDLRTRYKPITVRCYLRTLFRFNTFQATWATRLPGLAGLESEDLIIGWIHRELQRVSARNVGARLGVLRDFLEFLRLLGQIGINPVDRLREKYPARGWHGLALALDDNYPEVELDDLRLRSRFVGLWGSRMAEFVDLKRSLGAGYDFEGRTLAQLAEYLHKRGLTQEPTVTSAVIHTWLQDMPGISARTRNTKKRVAEMFFEHAVRHGMLKENPARFRMRPPPRQGHPFIFTTAQIQLILLRAAEFPDLPRFPRRGATYAAVLAILYCLGLRVSEACRLLVADVDLKQGMVHIRESKFYKSRSLPIGPRCQQYLSNYISLRKNAVDSSAAFFPTYPGKQITRAAIKAVLRRIVARLQLQPEPGQRGACLHSLRHSFAVHRIARWYREGADVQAKLPLLSAWLGHLDLSSTQVYLTATDDLLEAASVRFETRFGPAFNRFTEVPE